MPSTFYDRIDELREKVGTGPLVGTVEVDQIYAYNQEVGGWINFLGYRGPHTLAPRHGGEVGFLANALSSQRDEFLRKLADGVLGEDGITNAMIDCAEDISAYVAINAPVETTDLRRSGHPWVTDDGAVVYDRPPLAPRRDTKRARDIPDESSGSLDIGEGSTGSEVDKRELEEEKYYAREQAELVKDAQKRALGLRRQVRGMGGIAPHPDYDPDSIPLSVRRRAGMPYDYVSSELGFETFEDLLRAMQVGN